MLTSMMCVQTQSGGKLEFDVEPVQWNVPPFLKVGADITHGTITPTGLLNGVTWARQLVIGVERAWCTFSRPIFDGKCDIITELNRVDSEYLTVEWIRQDDKTSFYCDPGRVVGFFTKPFHMTIYPKK